MADTIDQLVDGFRQGLLEAPEEILHEALSEQPVEFGRQAAHQLVAPYQWARIVGEKLDTATVAQLLGVTRQAINKRISAGSLIGVPGRGTTYFPSWQFNFERGTIRPETRLIVSAFREQLEEADPYLIMSWVRTPQDEDLEGLTPVQWIQKGKESERLVEAARRAASRLAA